MTKSNQRSLEQTKHLMGALARLKPNEGKESEIEKVRREQTS
jgi:hypothetical protein